MIKLFTSVLMLLLAGTAFFGYTRPTYTQVQDLQTQVAQLDQILVEASEFQRLKGQLMSRYNALPSESLARLNKLLPDHVDNVRLILDVDSLAAQSRLSLENVIVNTVDASGSSGNQVGGDGALGTLGSDRLPYDSLTLQFKTVGTYDDFQQFMRGLQSSLRLVDVVGLSIQNVPNETKGSRTYTYSVKLQTYWLK